MGASDVLHLLELSGLHVSLRGESLAITPAEKITPDIRRLIQENKPGILAALENDTTSFRWLVRFTDREPLEVCTHPDAGIARMMREYPHAISAEPLPEPPRPPTSCATCTNSRKPGASRYCCARPELTPAYGEWHPLRQLPDDDGADCGQWLNLAG